MMKYLCIVAAFFIWVRPEARADSSPAPETGIATKNIFKNFPRGERFSDHYYANLFVHQKFYGDPVKRTMIIVRFSVWKTSKGTGKIKIEEMDVVTTEVEKDKLENLIKKSLKTTATLSENEIINNPESDNPLLVSIFDFMQEDLLPLLLFSPDEVKKNKTGPSVKNENSFSNQPLYGAWKRIEKGMNLPDNVVLFGSVAGDYRVGRKTRSSMSSTRRVKYHKGEKRVLSAWFNYTYGVNAGDKGSSGIRNSKTTRDWVVHYLPDLLENEFDYAVPRMDEE